jgi:hypothetical protein
LRNLELNGATREEAEFLLRRCTHLGSTRRLHRAEADRARHPESSSER